MGHRALFIVVPFSLAMIAIGIKPLSIGIVATTCMLILATIVLFILSVRGVKKGKQK